MSKVSRHRLKGLLATRRAGASPQRLLLITVGWVLLVGGIQLYAWQHMLQPLELLQALVQLCRTHPAGALLFIGVAALSPLLLMPAALLGSVAGICFGPALGVLYTLIGCNLSASLTYGLGCVSGRGAGPRGPLIERYSTRLRQNDFLYVVLLRLSFLPYDPVNYLIGLARVPWARFIAANTLGSLPGVLAIVLAGSAVEGLDHGLPMLNISALVGAAALLLLGVGLALVLRRRV